MRPDDYRRLGLQLSVNYTLMATHSTTLSSTFSESGKQPQPRLSQSRINPRLDYGNADYDVRHRLVIGGLYEPSWLDFKSNRVAHAVAGGLEFAPIAALRTGTPFTIYDCTNAANNLPARRMPAPGLQYHGTSRSANNGVNFLQLHRRSPRCGRPIPSSTRKATPISLNSSGRLLRRPASERNQFRGPNNYSFNLGVYKNIAFGPGADRYNVQLRAEFYNVLNHSNYYAEVGSADYVGPL